MAEIKTEKTICELLQEVRYELSKTPLKKSGVNAHLKFNYFELGDFLPTATKLFNERGLCPVFDIGLDPNGIEIATLTIFKGMEKITFRIPTDNPTNMSGIQAVGAKNTYMKRYCYMNALDLTENDVVDATIDGNEAPKEERKATEKQVEMINNLYDEENIEKMKEYFHISKVEELTMQQASQVIAKKKGNKNG